MSTHVSPPKLAPARCPEVLDRTRSAIGCTAQIRPKRGGKIIHTEAPTFDRKPAAATWLKKRERDLVQPGRP
jgi:hypothetical protein